jgi:hypothetical protein
MKKIVINRCHGGFGLSKKACELYWNLKGQQVWIEDDGEYLGEYLGGILKSLGIFTVWLVPPSQRIKEKEGKEFYSMSMHERIEYNRNYCSQTWYYRAVDRDDPTLVRVIEQMGDAANGSCAELAIVEIPDDVKWEIQEYDGMESVAETYRSWS